MLKKLLILGSIAILFPACSAQKALQSSPSPVPVAATIEASSSPTVADTTPLEMKGTNSTGLPLTVPTGFTLTTYSKDLVNPRVIIFDSNAKCCINK